MTICYGIYYTILYSTVLVGGFNPSEKYEFVNGKDYPFIWKIKVMFETTNQYTIL